MIFKNVFPGVNVFDRVALRERLSCTTEGLRVPHPRENVVSLDDYRGRRGGQVIIAAALTLTLTAFTSAGAQDADARSALRSLQGLQAGSTNRQVIDALWHCAADETANAEKLLAAPSVPSSPRRAPGKN